MSTLQIFTYLLIVSCLSHLLESKWKFTAHPSATLQKIFNIPSNGWIGGDEDTSLQLYDLTYLWLFGDSIIGTYDNKTKQRTQGEIIHSSIGEYNKQNNQTSMNWIWKSSFNNSTPNAFFNITSSDGSFDFVWVDTGITNNKDTAFLLAMEVVSESNQPFGILILTYIESPCPFALGEVA